MCETRQCLRCGWHGGEFHDPNCPVICNNLETWKAGYQAGRSGISYNRNADPTWLLGWRQGTAALEEAENV
jgi:hypothetical protein